MSADREATVDSEQQRPTDPRARARAWGSGRRLDSRLFEGERECKWERQDTSVGMGEISLFNALSSISEHCGTNHRIRSQFRILLEVNM